jgi:hypothetical protein
MKITYAQNPLETKVELDDHEKEILWYKIKVEQLKWLIIGANVYLEEGQFFNLDRAREEVETEWLYKGEGEDRAKFDKQVDEYLEGYLQDLTGTHLGDCTCMASSCGKCNAESLLEIDTIEGLRKHPGSYVYSAFRDGKRNLNEAIAYLETHKPTAKWKGWEAHADRWAAEQKEACEWLKAYRDKHFPLQTS